MKINLSGLERNLLTNRFITWGLVLCLVVVGFIFRLWGLENNYSFWSDETHAAIFARAIRQNGWPVLANGYSFGAYQWLQSWLSALSSLIFGLNEFGIRFPSLVFGGLTILMIFHFGKRIFNRDVGLIAAFLTAFLKIEILWSRQARPYQALQFFYLWGVLSVLQFLKAKKFSRRYFWNFFLAGVLASLMHGLGLLILVGGFLAIIFYLVRNCLWRYRDNEWRKKSLVIFFLLLALGFITYLLRASAGPIIKSLGKTNNLYYYRVFLSHHYLFLIFWSLIGFFTLAKKNATPGLLLLMFLALQGVVVSFILSQPHTRFFYPAFSLLILTAAIGIERLAVLISRRQTQLRRWWMVVLVLVTVIASSTKFSFWPQKIYSLNDDMQETPEVDWKKVYAFVGDKLGHDEGAVLVTNWTDLPLWFLGEGQPDYLLRKSSLVKLDSFTGAEFILTSTGLEEVVGENKQGLIVIDSWDDEVPDEVRAFIRLNFIKELEVDRLYSVQPRYWPVEVYSWGI